MAVVTEEVLGLKFIVWANNGETLRCHRGVILSDKIHDFDVTINCESGVPSDI